MTLTRDQEAAVTAPGSVAVLAGAGAGKTHMLAARYVHHLAAHGLAPLEVVAVTFTEKAASELRARIREDVRRHLGRPDLLAELEAAPISTLHALAARICREHPEEAGVAADFGVLDDLDGKLWQLNQLAVALDDLPPPAGAPVPFGLLQEALMAFLADPLGAEAALAVDPDAWRETCEAARTEALAAFVQDPEVRAARGTLDAYAGNGPIEAFRQDALRALMALTLAADGAETDVAGALATFAAINLKVGKAADWLAGGLKEVKDALKAVREAAKAAAGAGPLAWTWGEADERMAAMLPTLREAFGVVRGRLAAAKRRARLLDFADLEVHALSALEHEAVRAYYQARWKAFLVDEFQDTNPVQAQLLAHLTAGARLTIVGDEKQAIYGFRGADVAVFRRVAEAIRNEGGGEVTLGQSFRTHSGLMEDLNQVFRPVLGDLHRDLAGTRLEAPHPGPHLTLEAVEAEKGVLTGPRRRVEALHIAKAVQSMLAAGTPVYDKAERKNRPMRPGDVAVLARSWAPLDAFAEAFAAVGVPAVHAGGGDLLATREALDGVALLRVLANPADSLALAAVLRGPWFAVSDRELLAFAQVAGKRGWWSVLKDEAPPALVHAQEALAALMRARRTEAPSRLLQLADRLTGYSAVIANLAGAARRVADWAGFIDFVRQLEGGGSDADMVAKALARLAQAEVEVPRPALEAGDAVALMTIHASKGLEWPVVCVPDLARAAPGDFKGVRFEEGVGVALKFEDDEGEALVPGLFLVLKGRADARTTDEVRRLAYVALTRARDRVMLSAAAPSGGLLDVLAPGLEAAGCVPGVIPFGDEAALPPRLPDPAAAPLAGRLLLGPVGPGLTELPVTALSTYARCPQAFKFEFVDGHPGYGEGAGFAGRIGTLTHLALERDVFDPAVLAPFDPGLPMEAVQEAVRLARLFHEAPAFAAVRRLGGEREAAIRLNVGKLTFRGMIDLLGPDFVLDYKTNQHQAPEEHLLQVWAYVQAMGRTRAHLAYLRHEAMVTFDEETLAAAGEDAVRVANGIVLGAFEPAPAEARCARCRFQAICEDRVDTEVGTEAKVRAT